jgi:hypothetical protein
MKRFRLLRFYAAGVVVVIALAVWGVSRSRTAAGAAAPQQPKAGTVVPSRHMRMEPVEKLQFLVF